ncbi:MAG: hypothetical protein CL949_09010 [Erythrobacter sp.]|nr:hypothetical protein [Erythrobacter sp.]
MDEVAWLADGLRPFALVLIASNALDDTPLGPFGNIGVACASPGEALRLAAEADRRGILRPLRATTDRRLDPEPISPTPMPIRSNSRSGRKSPSP